MQGVSLPQAIRAWVAVVAVVLAVGARAASSTSVDPQSVIDPQVPAWVAAPLALPPPPPVASSSSIRMLVVEHQVDVPSAAHFSHYALRVESEAGLQTAGQVSVSYASTYQQLHWHYVRVWRDGRKRDVLRPEAVQVLRQEEDAERFMYHGYLSAVVILHDIRVGDVIEYAYTRVGENPVFDGRFSLDLPAGSTVPVDRLSYRVIEDRKHPLHVGTVGRVTLKHTVETSAAGVEHHWTGQDLAAFRPVSDAPSWDPQVPFIEMSDFASWAEVAAWGNRLFTLPPDAAGDTKEMLASVTQGATTPLAKANAVLRFVQDNVRYLGLELGESSHRPAAPGTVIQRRFGDCKDKALLLVTLLRQLGFDANVALVNSTWRRAVQTLLPSPLAFDHAIVCVVLPRKSGGSTGAITIQPGMLQQSMRLPEVGTSLLKSSTGTVDVQRLVNSLTQLDFAPLPSKSSEPEVVWLDATASLQGGSFTRHARMNFGEALVLRDGAAELTRVDDLPLHFNEVNVHEMYTAMSYDQPAHLDILTTYHGATADYYRYAHRYAEPAETMRQATGYLARFYPKVQSVGLPDWSDDRDANVITVQTHFVIPGLWTIEPTGKKRQIEIVPSSILERLPRPETVDRTAAFALSFPQDVNEDISLMLPKKWPWTPDHQEVDDGTFHFEYDTVETGATIHATYHWQTKADAVPATAAGEWTRKMAQVRDALGFRVMQNIRLAAEMERHGVVWPLLSAMLLGLAGGLTGGVILYRRRRREVVPPPLPGDPLVGISGWLILLGIGVTLRPLLLLRELWPNFRFIANHPGWVATTDVESVSYAPGLGLLVMAETFFGALFIGWSIVVLVQFFRKKASLPLALSSNLIAFAVWAIAHAIWFVNVGTMTPHATAVLIGGVFGSVGGALVWGSYLFVSRRVKRTFIC